MDLSFLQSGGHSLAFSHLICKATLNFLVWKARSVVAPWVGAVDVIRCRFETRLELRSYLQYLDPSRKLSDVLRGLGCQGPEPHFSGQLYLAATPQGLGPFGPVGTRRMSSAPPIYHMQLWEEMFSNFSESLNSKEKD